MKLSCLVLILLISTACADEIMFFADDRYKAVGAPEMEAAVINPLMEPGEGTVLRVVVANDGLVEELIPTSDDVGPEGAEEMAAEMKCVDALNITATLRGSGPIVVTSGSRKIDYLASGETEILEFSAAAGDGAGGPQGLVLDIEYEHQVDVSTGGGIVSPLYQPANESIPIEVLVRGEGGVLSVEGVSADLSPGGRGDVTLILRNRGGGVLGNCTAEMISAPPIESGDGEAILGDIGPGDMAVARFEVSAGGSAEGDYQLACSVSHDGGREVLPVSVSVSAASRPLGYAPLILIPVAGAAGLLVLRSVLGRSSRSRRP